MMSESNAGSLIMVGQITDAILQPLVSFGSDNVDTRLGKRYPWYLLGNLLLFPMTYLLFNPPGFAIGPADSSPQPKLWYFMLISCIMNIGQGMFQLSHLSIVNSLSYD